MSTGPRPGAPESGRAYTYNLAHTLLGTIITFAPPPIPGTKGGGGPHA